MDMKIDEELNRVLSDRKSGSSELAIMLNWYIKNISVDVDKLKKVIPFIRENFSSFRIITNYADRIESYLKQNDLDSIKKLIYDFENNLKDSNIKIYENAKDDLLKLKSVLTVSNSRTLSEVFKFWYRDNPKLRIVITESRPQMEGRELAKELNRNGIDAEIIVDSLLANFIMQVDGVVIGADTVLLNGNVVNKIGSLPAAIICRHYNKPFYVLASQLKISNELAHTQPMQSADEVWKLTKQKIIIHNFYFEVIENELITRIISD